MESRVGKILDNMSTRISFFFWEIGSSARRNEEFLSRALFSRSLDDACLSRRELPSARDICDFIIIAICGENLRGRNRLENSV